MEDFLIIFGKHHQHTF